MGSLGEISASITIDIGPLKRGFDKASGIIAKFTKTVGPGIQQSLNKAFDVGKLKRAFESPLKSALSSAFVGATKNLNLGDLKRAFESPLKSAFASSRKLATRFASRIESSMKRVRGSLFNLRNAIVAVGAAFAVRAFIQTADTFTLLESRIKLVTNGSKELANAQEKLLGIANETRISFEAVSNLYARFGRVTKVLGVSQEELLGITRTINQAITVSGATAQEASNGLIQLSQGLASNTLRGDELRSVLEQLPRLALAIADGMGVGIGKLREIAMQGGLSGKVVLDALKSQREVIEKEFNQMTMTVGQAFTVMKNNLQSFVFELNKATGINDILAKSIRFVADNITGIGKAITNSKIVEWLKTNKEFVALNMPVVLTSIGKIIAIVGKTALNVFKAITASVVFIVKQISAMPSSLKVGALLVVAMGSAFAKVAIIVVGIQSLIASIPVTIALVKEKIAQAMLFIAELIQKTLGAFGIDFDISPFLTKLDEATAEVDKKFEVLESKNIVAGLTGGFIELKKEINEISNIELKIPVKIDVEGGAGGLSFIQQAVQQFNSTVQEGLKDSSQNVKTTVEQINKDFGNINLVSSSQIREQAQTFIQSFENVKVFNSETSERMTDAWTKFRKGLDISALTKDMIANIKKIDKEFFKGLTSENLTKVIRDMPNITNAILQGLDVTIEKLKEMGAAGELTSEVINGAIEKSKEMVKKQTEEMENLLESFHSKQESLNLRSQAQLVASFEKTFKDKFMPLVEEGKITFEDFTETLKAGADEISASFEKETNAALGSLRKLNKATKAVKGKERLETPTETKERLFEEGKSALPGVSRPTAAIKVPDLDGFARGGTLNAFAKGGTLITKPSIIPMANGGTGIAGEAGTEAIFPLTKTGGGELGIKADFGSTIKDLFAESREQVDAFRKRQRELEDFSRNIFREMDLRSQRENPIRQALMQEQREQFNRSFDTSGSDRNQNLSFLLNIENNTGVEFDAEVGTITKDQDRIVGDLIIRSARTSRKVRDALGL